jgi:diaminopimelate epimerase
MIKFKKMHGNGNDFIVIENLTQTTSLTKTQIKQIGDRKKGIGFDQLITINPPKKTNHDLYIRFFNTDGSEASMCLNGVRSVGAFVWAEKLFPKKPMLLGTKSKEVLIQPTASKNVKTIIDFPSEEKIPQIDMKLLAKELNVSFVNAGNHHLLIESKKIDSYDLSSLCDKLRKRNFFKNSNISLWEKTGNSILSRTNEAGAGETLSCGSAAAAIASIVLKKGKGVTVISKGGKISLKSLGNKMEMTGPAEFICEGVWVKN